MEKYEEKKIKTSEFQKRQAAAIKRMEQTRAENIASKEQSSSSPL